MEQKKPARAHKISIIAALSRSNALGKDKSLLFRISDDLRRFKRLTRGHPVIMGRRTFESIGRPLPERTNIVVTRNPDFKAEGVVTAASLEEAIEKAASLVSRHGEEKEKEIFIIGGGEIFRQALPRTDKLYLTLVESDAQGDVFFPDWRSNFTKEVFREERRDEKTGLRYAWIDVERA